MDFINGMKLMLMKLTNKCVHMEINLSILMGLQLENVDAVVGWTMTEVPASLIQLMN